MGSVENQIRQNEYNLFKVNEQILHTGLDSKMFYDIMSDRYGYNYKTISRFIEGGVFTFHEQHNFNTALRTIRECGISIHQCVLFLEESFDMQNIIKFIDEYTKEELKKELNMKYHLGIVYNSINDKCNNNS